MKAREKYIRNKVMLLKVNALSNQFGHGEPLFQWLSDVEKYGIHSPVFSEADKFHGSTATEGIGYTEIC